MACSLGFYGDGGLVSGLYLASHSDSESFLVVHASFSQDGCQREEFWEVVGHAVSSFDLSQTLPVGGGLLVPYPLPKHPVIKQLMRMVTKGPDQDGRFQSVCFPQQEKKKKIHEETDMNLSGECNLLSSVSSQQKFEAMDIKALSAS